MVVLAIAQTSMWVHANHVVQAAAEHGAEVAAAHRGTDVEGDQAVRWFLGAAGGVDADSAEVSITRSGGRVVVELTAHAPSVIGELVATARAVTIVERAP